MHTDARTCYAINSEAAGVQAQWLQTGLVLVGCSVMPCYSSLPLPSSRRHLSNGDCLKYKMEN